MYITKGRIYRYTDIPIYETPSPPLPSPPLPSHLPYSTLSRTPINSFYLSVPGRDHILCERRANNKTVYSTCPYIHVHNIHIHGDNSAALRWPLVVSRHEAWPPREAGVRPSPRLFFFSRLPLPLPLPIHHCFICHNSTVEDLLLPRDYTHIPSMATYTHTYRTVPYHTVPIET